MAVEGAKTEATGTPIEAVSKIAALTSVALILALQFAIHPSVTWPIRALMVCALAGGWRLGHFSGMAALATVAGLAPLLPVAIAAVAGSADPVVQSVWLAALVGALLPSMTWTRWDLPAAWRVLLGGWALTLSLAWPILVAREVGFDLRGLGDTATINSWAGMSASEVSGWIMHVVLVQLAGLLWLDGLMRGLRTWSGRGLPVVVHGLWIGATFSSLVALYQGTVDLEFLSSTGGWAARGRATGMMLGANSYGMMAALAAPLAAVAAGSFSTRAWWLGAGAFAINWGGVWMSGSRTALLCALAGTVALAIGAVRRLRVRRAVWVSGAGVVAVAAVALAVVISRTTTPFERTEEVASRSPWQVAETLLARGRYGEIAARMIWEYPLTGVGVGTYHWLAPDYSRVAFNQGLPFDNAQNWWRHQLAELGMLGALPLLAWSIIIVWLTLRGAWRARGHHVAAVRGLLLGLGFVSLVGMPTQDPAVLMAFLLLVAMLATASPGFGAADTARTRASLSRAWMIVGVLAVAYAAGHAALAGGSLNVAERAASTNRDYIVGLYPEESHPDGGQYQWTGGEAHLRLVKRTPWLVVRTWIQHPDASERPVVLRIVTPCQVVFERTLVDSTPVDFVLTLPTTDDRIDLAVRVSRTWSPATFGSPDARELGAALMTEFVNSAAEANSPSTVAMEACGAARRAP